MRVAAIVIWSTVVALTAATATVLAPPAGAAGAACYFAWQRESPVLKALPVSNASSPIQPTSHLSIIPIVNPQAFLSLFFPSRASRYFSTLSNVSKSLSFLPASKPLQVKTLLFSVKNEYPPG